MEKLMPDGVTRTTYQYQPFSGRLASIKRPNQQGGATNSVNFSYAIDGRLSNEAYADGSTVAYQYTYQAVVNGVNSSFVDPLGRVRAVIDSIGTHTMTYKGWTGSIAGAGQLSEIDGPLTNDDLVYQYDWQDRVITQEVHPDSGSATRSETMAYDTLGRVQSVTSTLGSFLFNYTGTQMRPASIQGPVVSSNFTYAPNNAPGHSARALSGISHTFNGTELAGHTYSLDKAGRITTWQKRSSVAPTVTQTFSHNLRDELLEATARDASQNLINQEIWGLDHGGNWLSFSQSETSLMQTRTVNSLNQLTRIGGAGNVVVAGHINERSAVTVNGQSATMQGDPVSNGFLFRKVVPVTPGSNTLEISAVDEDDPPNTTTQNWSFTVPPAQRTFQYDPNGNLTSDSNGRVFTWDAKNRLKRLTVGFRNYEWDYDYRDRRVREYEYSAGQARPAEHKQFVWFENDIMQEREFISASSVSITRNHYFGGFAVGATNHRKYQTLTDHLGNIREIVVVTENPPPQIPGAGFIDGTLNPPGTILTRYDYSAYQGPTKVYQFPNTTVEATFRTIGRYYHHAATGLALALYRAYDAELGRWISEDPLGERGGLNLYCYVLNRPTAAIDPLGLDLFYLNDPKALGGIGHAGFVSGDDASGYQYRSFSRGPDKKCKTTADNLDKKSYPYPTSLKEVMKDLKSQGYTGYAQYSATPAQDQAAIDAIDKAFANTIYKLMSHNCDDMSLKGVSGGGSTAPKEGFTPNGTYGNTGIGKPIK